MVAAMQNADMKVCAAVVGYVDASPILQLAEHALEGVALTIKSSVVRDRRMSIDLRRDARCDAAFGQSVAEPIGAVSPISNHPFGVGQRVEHERGTFVVATGFTSLTRS